MQMFYRKKVLAVVNWNAIKYLPLLLHLYD